MKKRIYIPISALPFKLPLESTLVWWMALDKFQAPGWVCGIIGFLLTVIWVGWICDVFTSRSETPAGYGKE